MVGTATGADDAALLGPLGTPTTSNGKSEDIN